VGKGLRVREILRQADDAMYQEKNTNKLKTGELIMQYLAGVPDNLRS
jgi:hypothetical protein